MQTSANRRLSSHEQLQEFYLDLLRRSNVSLIARHASVAATQWDDCGCGYKPGDSSARFLTWMNGAVLLSTDIPSGTIT